MATNNSSNIKTGILNTLLLGQGVGTALDFSTATYPPTTTINQLLYSSAANTITGLVTANNGLLVTSSAGVPSILAGSGTTGTILQANAAAAPSWSTTTYPSTSVLGDTLYGSGANVLSALAGNTTAVKQYLSQTGTGVVSAAPSWATISGGDITGAALTAGNDTNVTLTTGGTPATSLLRAASITAGWTGQLSLARGGTNAALVADNGAIPYSTATAIALLASTATAGKVLQSGSSAAPSWSTPTYPSASGTAGKILRSDGTNNVYTTSTFADTYSASNLLYSNGANTVTGLATANSASLVTNSAGVPAWSGSMTNGQVIIGSTGATPTAATLTAGTGIGITNAAASITLATNGVLKSFQIFAAGTAATYTKPAGINNILVQAVGGGGAGGGVASTTSNGSAGGGGGAGGFASKLFTSASATYTYTVGAGGTPGAAGNVAGGNGGNTTFSTLTANGGTGGNGSAAFGAAASTAAGGAGGSSSGTDYGINGQVGNAGVTNAAAGVGLSVSGSGGNSPLGYGAPSVPQGSGGATAGTAASGPGGGGSGAAGTNANSNQAGGAGAAGYIIVWEFS